MPYVINKRFKNYINYESVKSFMRENGLSPTGIKSELIDRIELSINSRNLLVDVWENFLVDQIRHGHNRTIYRTKLNPASLNKVNNKNRLLQSLLQAGFRNEKFSVVHNRVPNSEEHQMIHFDYKCEENEVESIEMCFAYQVLINKVVEDGQIIIIDETDYVWIHIDNTNELFTLSVRPRSNTSESSGRTFQLYEHYSNFLTKIFSIKYLSNDDFKGVLYNIFKELTTKAETPYVTKVAPLVPEINEVCSRWAVSLGLPSSQEPVNLSFRFKRLLERALIQDDFFAFRSYSEGKQGTIDKFYYADESGARVNASASEGDGIELSDIYFDTRETIDDQRMFNKLWVTWFLPKSQSYKESEVRIEATSKYYLIHFFKYLSGGEKEHVLSTIETFREL